MYSIIYLFKSVQKKRGPGRPKKIARVRPNSGRKPILDMNNVGRTSRYLKAKKIIKLVNNNEEFLEYTLELCRKMNKSTNKVLHLRLQRTSSI